MNMDKLKQAYISNRRKQIDALQSGDDALFWYYGARILRAINALIECSSDEADAAFSICEWESELAGFGNL